MQGNPYIRIEYLIGSEKLEKIKHAHIAIFGCGGVGSFAIEGLIRSGVKEVTLIDFDTIDVSNLNRQLMTSASNIGQSKVEVMRERILSIHPDVLVHLKPIFFNEESKLSFEPFDYVIDAIDAVPSKLEIMRRAEKANVPMIMALGTARKLDPSQLRLNDLYHTSYCPLAKKVRILARKEGLRNIKVVTSLEESKDATFVPELNKVVVGSMIFVPASAGLLLASTVIQDLCQDDVIIKKMKTGKLWNVN